MSAPSARLSSPGLETALSQWARWVQAGEPAPGDPPVGLLAHRVETILQHMESNGRWKEARVLRADRLLADLPECQRLYKLARVGLTLRRSAYYAYLQSALAYVDGALSVSLPAPTNRDHQAPSQSTHTPPPKSADGTDWHGGCVPSA